MYASTPLESPQDLRHYTLLHVEWHHDSEIIQNWRMWLRAAGVGDIDPERGPRPKPEVKAFRDRVMREANAAEDR